ncbi:MAG: type II toxin-antitoxin system mRNA interferase toxin, RelE/StbE family [Patescibacteria group bacterium]
MIDIYFSPRFKKSIKKIPYEVIEILTQKQSLFIINPFNPALKTHKLTGKLSQYYSFSITNSYRIIFEFLSKNKVIFINIGTHEIYKS